MAVITASDEIAKLRRSGQIAAHALEAVVQAVQPGLTTAELNRRAESTIMSMGGQPSFKDYENYGFGLCTSINDEVVHGLPSERRLANGDIIGLDIGVKYQGLFSDHARTVGVGSIAADRQRLIDDTAESLRQGLKQIKAGRQVGDISAAIEQYLRARHYGIVTQLTGHGLGYAVHEPPSIPNFGQAGTGPKLEVGMVLAIEPMVTLGQPEVQTKSDGWTVVTVDHSMAAHFEHTVLVTSRGCDIITQL